jgi:hypothetical protein
MSHFFDLPGNSTILIKSWFRKFILQFPRQQENNKTSKNCKKISIVINVTNTLKEKIKINEWVKKPQKIRKKHLK